MFLGLMEFAYLSALEILNDVRCTNNFTLCLCSVLVTSDSLEKVFSGICSKGLMQ